ncbi:hypothetical protein D3C76_1870510 [compost metagenome]
MELSGIMGWLRANDNGSLKLCSKYSEASLGSSYTSLRVGSVRSDRLCLAWTSSLVRKEISS